MAVQLAAVVAMGIVLTPLISVLEATNVVLPLPFHSLPLTSILALSVASPHCVKAAAADAKTCSVAGAHEPGADHSAVDARHLMAHGPRDHLRHRVCSFSPKVL